MMSESRDEEAANYAGLANINLLLILAGFATMIEICQVKYLNNIIEQDHLFIKKNNQTNDGI
jgi:putative transposase